MSRPTLYAKDEEQKKGVLKVAGVLTLFLLILLRITLPVMLLVILGTLMRHRPNHRS